MSRRHRLRQGAATMSTDFLHILRLELADADPILPFVRLAVLAAISRAELERRV